MIISAPPDAETGQIGDNDGNGIDDLTLQTQNALMITIRGKLFNGMRFIGSKLLIVDEDDGKGKKNQNQEQNQEQEGWHYGGGNDHQDNGQHVGDKHCR